MSLRHLNESNAAPTSSSLFRHALIVTPSGSYKADIAVQNGKIIAIGTLIRGDFSDITDLDGWRVLPGCIDPHVHFALPVGNRMTCDDFSSGSRKALAGGVTTVIDFSTPAPGVTLAQAIRRRCGEAAAAQCSVFLHATVCGWNAAREAEACECLSLGVRSFKFFTAYEESGRRTSYQEIEAAAIWATRNDARIIIHAEDQASLRSAEDFPSDSFRYYEASRPVESEVTAIRRIADIQQRTGAAMAIVHVSSGSGVRAACGSGIRAACGSGIRAACGSGVSAACGSGILKLETCPHYLTKTRDVYNAPDGFRFAVAPPLRSAEQQQLLWEALSRGDIDWIGSDHAPFSADERNAAGDHFTRAPFGLAGVDSILPTLIHEGIFKKRISWEQLVTITSENAARFYGIYPQKGCIAVGSDADLVAVDETGRIQVLCLKKEIIGQSHI